MKLLKKNLGNYRVSGLPFPLFTGYIHGFRTLGYNGGFQLRDMAKWRGDTNPDGSGKHAWDGGDIQGDLYGIKYYIKDGRCVESGSVYRPFKGSIIKELEWLNSMN